jgi:hypothetical protein
MRIDAIYCLGFSRIILGITEESNYLSLTAKR